MAQPEKLFYLEHFRHQSLVIADRTPSTSHFAAIEAVVADLAANETRVVVVVGDDKHLPAHLPCVQWNADELAGDIWRCLQDAPAVIVVAEGKRFHQKLGDVVHRIGCDKLALLREEGGLSVSSGRNLSFVDSDEIRALLAHPQILADEKTAQILRTVESLLGAGVPSVNLCKADGLADEFFTYFGSGTLFTREHYLSVRPLQLKDFGPALALVQNGIEAGHLAPGRAQESEKLLGNGFGAFIGGDHLAGIVALLPERASEEQPRPVCAEVAGLATVTRFIGHGIAQPLLAFVLRHARHLGLQSVYACTTSERAGKFFERQGFASVGADDLPASKWDGYDQERRESIRCFRFEL